MAPKCVCCGSEAVVLVGAIPPATTFAGRKLDQPLQGGDLIRCLLCGLAFRYPRLDKVDLDALYLMGDADNWQTPVAARRDWQIASQWIARYLKPDSLILDVGCFDGGFLRSLGSAHKRFGIEIHEAAGAKARACGINLISTDFAAMPKNIAAFDVVTSFDVIEHAHNPMDFLSNIAGITRQNGLVIISTGNSESPSWRLVGSSYWYCVIGEHLSFINPTWCAWAAPHLGLELKRCVTFSHNNATWTKRLVDVIKNLFFAVSPRTFVWLRTKGLYRGNAEQLNAPPYWGSAKDHCIYLFVKK